MKKHNLMAVVCLAGLVCSAGASAADEAIPKESYASALLGAEVPTTSGGSNSFTFSGRVGTGLFSDRSGIFSLGLFVNHASSSSSVGTVTVTGSSTPILAELITRRMFGSGLYLGGRIGINLGSATIASQSASYSASATSFMVGPAAGYELPISPILNFDVDVTWLSNGGATFNFPTLGSIQTQSATAFAFQGGLTYHW